MKYYTTLNQISAEGQVHRYDNLVRALGRGWSGDTHIPLTLMAAVDLEEAIDWLLAHDKNGVQFFLIRCMRELPFDFANHSKFLGSGPFIKLFDLAYKQEAVIGSIPDSVVEDYKSALDMFARSFNLNIVVIMGCFLGAEIHCFLERCGGYLERGRFSELFFETIEHGVGA